MIVLVADTVSTYLYVVGHHFICLMSLPCRLTEIYQQGLRYVIRGNVLVSD